MSKENKNRMGKYVYKHMQDRTNIDDKIWAICESGIKVETCHHPKNLEYIRNG